MPSFWKIWLALWILHHADPRDYGAHPRDDAPNASLAFGASRGVWELRRFLWKLKRADQSMRHIEILILWHPSVRYSATVEVASWWEYVNVVKLPGGDTAVRSIGAIKTISLPDAVAIAKEQALEVLNAARYEFTIHTAGSQFGPQTEESKPDVEQV